MPDEPVPAPAGSTLSLTRDHYERLRAEQNLPLALFAGVGAAVVGALIWAALTVTTEFQIGYMAVAIGFLVGYAVRLGKGLDRLFGITGAILALLGCVLGNFLSIVGFVSKQSHLGLLETLGQMDYSKIPQIMTDAFSVMDLVFYAIAIYEGYRFSFRRLSAPDLGTVPPATV